MSVKPSDFTQENDFIVIRKKGNTLRYYENWLESCWQALYKKPQYKGLPRTQAIDLYTRERFGEIARLGGYRVLRYSYSHGILFVEMENKAMNKTVYIAGLPEAAKENKARMEELGNMLREGGYEVTGRQGAEGIQQKEPWQMTYSEFFPFAGSEYTSGERFGIPTKNRVPVIPETGFGEKGATPEERVHRAVVRKALREKKPVPQEVLAEYPDLARIYGRTGNHLPPVKEPWQMTKEEFKKTASPLKNREDFIKAWLRDNENIPNKVRQGINQIPQRDGALFVYGNEKGEPVGVVSFRKDAVDAIAVSDRYKNRGIATLLLEEARKYGVRRTEGLISPEFAGIAHRFAVKTAFLEGKPIPPAVLREYPDLMMKAEKQKWRRV